MLMSILLKVQDPDLRTYVRIRPYGDYINQVLRIFTTEELSRFVYETISIPRIEETAYTPAKSRGFALSINLASSTETDIEIFKLYRWRRGFFVIETVALPLSSTAYFQSMGGLAGILVLACLSKLGVNHASAVFFGEENGIPWCELETALSDIKLEDATDGQLAEVLMSTYWKLDAARAKTDRWKGRLSQYSDGRMPRVEVAIRRVLRIGSPFKHERPMLALNISVSPDERIDRVS